MHFSYIFSLQLFGPLVRKITLRQLLGMRSGLQEYDNPSVRRYQNIHRSEDLCTSDPANGEDMRHVVRPWRPPS